MDARFSGYFAQAATRCEDVDFITRRDERFGDEKSIVGDAPEGRGILARDNRPSPTQSLANFGSPISVPSRADRNENDEINRFSYE